MIVPEKYFTLEQLKEKYISENTNIYLTAEEKQKLEIGYINIILVENYVIYDGNLISMLFAVLNSKSICLKQKNFT